MSRTADPLLSDNPYLAQTRLGNLDARLQRLKDKTTNQTAARDMATRAINAGANPSAIPQLPDSRAGFADFDRRMSHLPGAIVKPPGPATIQNTGVTGVKSSTPDFGQTRVVPGQDTEAWQPDNSIVKGGGRWVGTTGTTPAQRIAANKQPVVNPPAINTPLPTTLDASGNRTVAIDTKYQTPASQIGKGEVVGSGTAAPVAATGSATGTDPNAWRYALKARYPNIFTAGTPENARFVDAHRNADGTMQSVDPAKALGIAEQVTREKASDDTALAQHQADVQQPGDAAALAAHNTQKPGAAVGDAVGAAVPQKDFMPGMDSFVGLKPPTPAASPSATSTTSTVPPADSILSPAASGIVQGVKDFGSRIAGQVNSGLDALKNPISTATNGILNTVGAVGGAVAPLVLSPSGVDQARTAFNNFKGNAQAGAALDDSVLQKGVASTVGLPTSVASAQMGVAKDIMTPPPTNPVPMPTESDDERKQRLAMVGLPSGY